MANLFEHKDRRVVPNWRSFGRTTVLGELNSFQKLRKESVEESSIEEYIIDWKLNQTVPHAADLLSAAFVNDKREKKAVLQAAQFILSNEDKATRSQISLAQQIITKQPEADITSRFNDIGIASLSVLFNPQPFYDKIKETKALLRAYSFNPILYVELSRYYSILGQEESSIQAMKTALHLASNNRFILRSATRLFAHYHTEQKNHLDYIHRFLRNSPMTKYDPWLTSAEISISTIRGRNSKLIKKGIELINSRNIAPFNFTELASSIGTIELLNGSLKKSREFFNKALLDPNDNSLAQIEWATTKDNQLHINHANFEVRMNFEALALDNYHNSEYDKALDNASKWLADQPFSKRPVMFGSNLASTILKDQEKSIAFLNAGLISHPNDPQLINNLAYSLALENKSKEALEQLVKVKHATEINQVTQICLMATKGLAFFRSGLSESGRHLYLEAIEQTKKINNQNLNWIALLNYAREELLQGSEYVEPIMEAVLKIPENPRDIEIKTLRIDVMDLFEKHKVK